MALGKLGLKGKGWAEIILGFVGTQVKVIESEERENKNLKGTTVIGRCSHRALE